MNNNEIITPKFKTGLIQLKNKMAKLIQNAKVIDLNTQNFNLCKNNFQIIEEKCNNYNQIFKNNETFLKIRYAKSI